MSLSKQMIIFITVMVITLLLGTFALNINNTKNFLQEQLLSHAQDTATSLGLSLSSVPDPDDISSMETMINAVFDRGYYEYINLKDMEGVTLYHRENSKKMEAVPSWFIDSIPLETPNAQALVQAGWIPLGTLEVSSHAGYAYVQLWETTKNLLIWFVAAALIAIVIAIYTTRLMLTPLKKMEKQAEAIVKKQYLLQEKLPSTTEFKQVVVAMNAMVGKLKSVFERDANNAERLQKMAFQDSVTGLSNRRHFDMLFDTLLDPKEDATFGSVFLLRIHDLKEFNDQFGYPMGDKLVKQLATKIKQLMTTEDALFARLNGTEIIAILPRLRARDIELSAKQVTEYLATLLQELQVTDDATSVSAAVMDYQPGQKRGALLGQLDFAIEQAVNEGKNCSYLYHCDESSEHEETWQDTLNQAIQEKRFVLYQQSAYNENHEIHDQELLLRLKDADGVVRSAGYFMPEVERFNMTATIDEMVFNLVIHHLKSQTQTPLVAINLSKAIIENESFQQSILQKLQGAPEICRRIAVELPEKLVIDHKGLVWPLLKKLSALGVKIGIDQFGSRFINMRYLQDLHPDYVKLDASFCKVFDDNEQTHNYISSLCELTDSLDIAVIAMAVETEEQMKAMTKLGVHYFQGYLFGAPTLLK